MPKIYEEQMSIGRFFFSLRDDIFYIYEPEQTSESGGLWAVC
jgi:hypothetical protein